jgi:hypothetical protein
MAEQRDHKTEKKTEMANARRKNIMHTERPADWHANIRILASERGIALAIVLILAAISLAIMAGLVYMLVSGTQVSGMQKRYKTAQEAALGGADITFLMIAARGNPGIPGINFLINPNIGTCLDVKLKNPTSGWGACDSSLTIDPKLDPGSNTSYDTTIELGPETNRYKVYSKIVDTVQGNSGDDVGLSKGGVVSSSGEINVKSVPYFYTIEIDAEHRDNPAERAKFSVLYEY